VVTKRRGADIFTRQTESIRFHIAREEARWLERHEKPQRSVEVVIDFGCGVQFVPHLMIEAIAVCERLGVDAVGVVGPQFCCGQPYRQEGKPASGDNMADNSFKRMAALRPLAMVQWCGAAQVQFGKRAEAGANGAEVLHMTAFLARRVAELGEPAEWKRRVDARVLVHRKSQDPMPFADRGPVMSSYDLVPAMLQRVPGVRVVGELRALPSTLPCEDGVPAAGSAAFALAREGLAAAARAAGADRVVCEHHQCLREWGKLASETLPVQHYLSVLAEALDVAAPDRFHEHWRAGDTDAIVDLARTQWSSWGVAEDAARDIAQRLFARS
jgi:hypothetical protein